MDSIGTADRFKKAKPKKNRYLHSPDHLLADELSTQLKDPKHFGLYLKMATLYDHHFLRKLAGEVMENKNVSTPGKLFTYLIKKYNEGPKKTS
jgi:hypothetical protein